MNKRFNFRAALLTFAAVLASVTFSACNDDDDNGNGTPSATGIQIKVEITDETAPYKSIELAPSGRYFVTKNKAAAQAGAKTRAEEAPKVESDVLTGNYVKIGDNTYDLEYIGRAIIAADGSVVTIQPLFGPTETYAARLAEAEGKYDKICRSWKVSKFNIYIKAGPEKLDKTFDSYEAFENFIKSIMDDDDEDYDYWVKSRLTRALSPATRSEAGDVDYNSLYYLELKNMCYNEVTFSPYPYTVYLEPGDWGYGKPWLGASVTVDARLRSYETGECVTGWQPYVLPVAWTPTSSTEGTFYSDYQGEGVRRTFNVKGNTLNWVLDMSEYDEEDGEFTYRVTFIFEPVN